MLTSELDYDLPESLIATRPAEPRDACRLMVVWRSDPGRVEHRVFRDLPGYLRAGDTLVFNTSAVLPARLSGVRADTGGRIDGLFVRAVSPGVWVVLLRASNRLRPRTLVELRTPQGSGGGFALELLERDEDSWRVRLHRRVGDSWAGCTASEADVLAAVGATPLPPYILKARKDHQGRPDEDQDREWYQCVYADRAKAGSVAAPTAGLHFTPGLLDTVAGAGVRRADVVLHVGVGTFKPIDAATVEAHDMHEEWVDVPGAALAEVQATRRRGGRLVCVGTTSVRAMESLPEGWELDTGLAETGFQTATRLFITPGFRYRQTQGLITNFHLPRSTLLAMVGALFDGGVPRLIELYRLAVGEGYRFYSYGDAMLILP
ncbi:MAG: tRNA preQ1(34) S-adenosylmethionine ribosyltransferase-isomerase QueA [Phycisphaerales bacterium]|nr:tRNA preQ1(34) S-adenosylmethionine ribosyltransferase-isomerase QueA [Phycisphaerales bacterium]